MAGIHDVARQAGVSPITVSRVVNNHPNVAATTRQRVLDAITELNYIPNAVARGLKRSRSGLIALIITDISSSFFTAVARGAEEAARAAGLVLVLGNSDESSVIEAEYLRTLGEMRVDGLILVPSPEAEHALTRRLPRNIPVVLLDRHPPTVNADVVRSDTRVGTYELCRHILALGHRRIAIVAGLPVAHTWEDRVAGYRDALRDAGLPDSARLEFQVDIKAPPAYDVGVAAVAEVFAQGDPPDVILASNAQVCLGVLDGLAERGYRIPDDIGVASIDDPLPDLRRSGFWPLLTVVEQPAYDMGVRAVEMLVARIQASGSDTPPREIVFPTTLRIGTSCGEGRPVTTSATPTPVAIERPAYHVTPPSG